jgi:hypothetical protein
MKSTFPHIRWNLRVTAYDDGGLLFIGGGNFLDIRHSFTLLSLHSLGASVSPSKFIPASQLYLFIMLKN